MMMVQRILTVVMCLNSVAQGATVLSPGDIQVIGFHSDSPDSVAWVNWVSLTKGTEVHFTDNGWRDPENAFRRGERELTWTATTDLAAGSVIVMTHGKPVNLGSTAGSLSGLSASGDQVFAYQGASAAPAFVTGLDFNGGAGWDDTATSTRTSALPDALSGISEFAVTHFDNGEYTGPRAGLSITAFKASVDEAANWRFGNSSSDPLSTQPFTLASGSVPEPASWLLWIAVAASFLLIRVVMAGRRF